MIETWAQSLPHGITLSCRAAGQRGRPVLLFLHGFPEGAFIWDELLHFFAQPENGGYRCVAPNLRGFEASSRPTDVKDYRAKYLVQDILALIDSEVGSNGSLAALVAHDWGGAVAWNLVNQHPQRVDRLAIINSPHPGTFLQALQNDPDQQAASEYMNALILPDAQATFSANDFARLFSIFSATPDTPPSASAPLPVWMTPALKERYRALWQSGLDGGLNYYRASPLRPPRSADPAAAAITLPPEALRIERPTLVLWGQKDHALLPVLTQGLEAYIPDLKLVPLPHASHWVVHEEPERVRQELAIFLRSA